MKKGMLKNSTFIMTILIILNLFSCATMKFKHLKLNADIHAHYPVINPQAREFSRISISKTKRKFERSERYLDESEITESMKQEEPILLKVFENSDKTVQINSSHKLISAKLFSILDFGKNEVNLHEYCGIRKTRIKLYNDPLVLINLFTFYIFPLFYHELGAEIQCYD